MTFHFRAVLFDFMLNNHECQSMHYFIEVTLSGNFYEMNIHIAHLLNEKHYFGKLLHIKQNIQSRKWQFYVTTMTNTCKQVSKYSFLYFRSCYFISHMYLISSDIFFWSVFRKHAAVASLINFYGSFGSTFIL